MIYELTKTDNGYIITSGPEKYVLNPTKISSSAPYYLKMVEPQSKYITGLFVDKKKENKLHGKTVDGRRVTVILNVCTVSITIN